MWRQLQNCRTCAILASCAWVSTRSNAKSSNGRFPGTWFTFECGVEHTHEAFGLGAHRILLPPRSQLAAPERGVVRGELAVRDGGATIDGIVAARGWQPNTVRAAISGALVKRLSLTIASGMVAEYGRAYMIADT